MHDGSNDCSLTAIEGHQIIAIQGWYGNINAFLHNTNLCTVIVRVSLETPIVITKLYHYVFITKSMETAEDWSSQNSVEETITMWANAQRDGRPAEYRWRPLFNTAKFGWCPLLDCRAVTLQRRKTRWNLLGCPKLADGSQPLVGWSSPYCEDMWGATAV